MNGKHQRALRQSQSAGRGRDDCSLDPASDLRPTQAALACCAGKAPPAFGVRRWSRLVAVDRHDPPADSTNLAASYGMNIWNRAIFDALEQRDATTVFFLSMVYFPLLAAVFAWSLPRSTSA